MGFILTLTFGLVVWIVFWALGAKGIDAFLLGTPNTKLTEEGKTLKRRIEKAQVKRAASAAA